MMSACPHTQGTHEDKENVHIVMELCGGGELFDSIVESGSFSEKKAALVFRKMVEVVSVIRVARCHIMCTSMLHQKLQLFISPPVGLAVKPSCNTVRKKFFFC